MPGCLGPHHPEVTAPAAAVRRLLVISKALVRDGAEAERSAGPDGGSQCQQEITRSTKHVGTVGMIQ